jgi:hypothetical protein
MKLKKPRNCKTTFFGFTTVLTGIALIIKGSIVEGVAAITTGLGLGMAKDFDKTGI